MSCDLLSELNVTKSWKYNATLTQLLVLEGIRDSELRRGWEKLYHDLHGIELPSNSKPLVIAVFGLMRKHSDPPPGWIDCRKVECRDCDDLQAYAIGGTSRVLQLHVVKQIACLNTIKLVVEHVRKWQGSKDVSLACDWGKHRSMAIACLCRELCFPDARIKDVHCNNNGV